jgi:hypothetical protein
MSGSRTKAWLRDCADLSRDARDMIAGIPGVLLAVWRLWIEG